MLLWVVRFQGDFMVKKVNTVLPKDPVKESLKDSSNKHLKNKVAFDVKVTESGVRIHPRPVKNS